MIWSLIKISLFVVLIAAITFAFGLIIDAGGLITMQFANQELSLTPIQAMAGMGFLIIVLWLLVWVVGIIIAIFKFFNGDETAISRYFNKSKEERGYKALTDSMVALASGESKNAINNATRAERLLKRPQLTNLINAQVAEAFGDNKRAFKYYKRLLDNDQTRFIGVQGLLNQKLIEEDTETALLLAKKAFLLRPNHDHTLNVLFDLQTGGEDWKGAQKTIQANVRSGRLPKDVGRRREAVLSLADARQMLEAGDIDSGKKAALAANKSSPDLIPAAILAAEMHMLDDNKRLSTKVLKKAWSLNPHPDLAAAFAEIDPNESNEVRRKRFSILTKININNAETKLLIAELALADEDFPSARRAVQELADVEPTVRSLAIMAAIEKGEGADDKTVRAWLNKALTGSRGPQWLCDSCSNIHSNWQIRCENCKAFDSLSWKSPPTDNLKTSSAMLDFTSGVLTDASASTTISDALDAEVIDKKSN